MLEQFKVLENLSKSQIEALAEICEQKNYPPDVFLFHEEEEGKEIYFLMSGTVGVYKVDPNTQTSLKFTELPAGQSIGELSFADLSPRSCSVKTETDVTVSVLDRQKLIKNLPKHQQIIKIVNQNIARQTQESLRSLNNRHAFSLQKQIEEFKERGKLSHFLFILILGFFMVISLEEFAEDFLPERTIAESTVFHWIYLIVGGIIPAILLFLKVDFPFRKVFAIKENFKKSLLDGLIFSTLGVAVIFGACVVLHPIFPEEEFLPSFLSISFSATTLFYAFHSYLQQFFRATIQLLIQRFLLDRKGYISVIVTALVFAIVHATYGFESMVVTLIIGTVFGLIYRRTYNLLGVSIVHFVLGSVYFHMGR